MPDYQKGKIYKLVSDHTDEIYIGSTIQKLCARLGGHACGFRKGIIKCTSKKLFELGKVKIVLIENCPCDSKEQLLKRERHYIESMVCININIPGRTMAENYQDKKEHYQKINKEYKLKNKDKIKEQTKEYRLKNKDKIKEYCLKNKDKIKERNKVRTICDCGLDVTKNDISKHKKTKRHMDRIKSKMELPTL